MSHEKEIGRPVIYRAKGGETIEAGTIFGFNDAVVFVRYAGSDQPKATERADLTYVPPRSGLTGSMEERARQLIALTLAETTINPDLIPAAIETGWFHYLPLVSSLTADEEPSS